MTESSAHNNLLTLVAHSTARSKAVAVTHLVAGTCLLTSLALSTTLLHLEKGNRCDNCHCLASPTLKLRKCTGCASYWYCSTKCQDVQWRAHHKKICKHFARYITSPQYQALSEHDRVDAVLLSHLLAEFFPDDKFVLSNESLKVEPHAIFMDLLKGPLTLPCDTLPTCQQFRRAGLADLEIVTRELYLRFGNNNFIVHSHLNSYAHGIFPLASRYFNHSCVPNAVAKYLIHPTEPVRMEIVALRDIAEGEEVTIPYLDPALPLEIRREALQMNYGFLCSCPLCSLMEHIRPSSPPAWGYEDLMSLENKLCTFTLGSSDRLPNIRFDRKCFMSMPAELAPLLHDSYLPGLSEIFSRAAHEGDYDRALSSGRTLLALYVLLYPSNYPQIGMHALELAKTSWNKDVTDMHSPNHKTYEDYARAYLKVAAQVLGNYGEEGDEGGPLEEIRVLHDLLNAQR